MEAPVQDYESGLSHHMNSVKRHGNDLVQPNTKDQKACQLCTVCQWARPSTLQ